MSQRSALLLLIAALGGCSTIQSAPEPAMPSSRASREPINKQAVDPQFSRARNTHAADSRARRESPEDAGQDTGEPPRQSQHQVTTRYVFGVSNPTVFCAVSHVCDVELQAGEKVTIAPRIGDKSRWAVDLLMAGQAPNETPHLTVMPLEVGAETSLVVMTNKRTYHLYLRATRSSSMLHTVFTYPEDLNARWNALGAKTAPTLQAVTPSPMQGGQ